VVNINAAITAYSHSGGNCNEALRPLCHSDKSAAAKLAALINELQGDIFDLVWSRSEAGALSAAQIEQIASAYLAEKKPELEIDDIGVSGLMRYIIWMAWHEGCLRHP
jgi:hypothetical protein